MEAAIEQATEQCPRCESDRVHAESKWKAFGAGVIFLVLGLALVAVFWPVGAIVTLFGLVAMIAAPFGGQSYKCRECGKSFNV